MRVAALALALLGAGPVVAADAPPYPARTMLVDALTDTALRVACEPPEGMRMTCAFTEIRVEPGKDAEGPLPPKSECACLPTLRSALIEGVAPPGLDAEAFTRRFARRGAVETADYAALFDALSAYCADAPDSATRLAAVMRDRKRGSCTLAVSAYSFDFDFSGGTWETRSEPSADGCGTVRFGAFAQPSGPRAPWSYRVGSRPGPDAGPGCPAAETEHIYATAGIDMQAGCDYLRFTD
ncbi:MAG TPA: hypothetical protein PKA74_16485 [Bauldia sp.]|nr:hypothetical protein [Bauldia sp.]